LRLFGVYHPSQQNTQTGLVTPAMYATVLRRVRRFLEENAGENKESVQKKTKTVARQQRAER